MTRHWFESVGGRGDHIPERPLYSVYSRQYHESVHLLLDLYFCTWSLKGPDLETKRTLKDQPPEAINTKKSLTEAGTTVLIETILVITDNSPQTSKRNLGKRSKDSSNLRGCQYSPHLSTMAREERPILPMMRCIMKTRRTTSKY